MDFITYFSTFLLAVVAFSDDFANENPRLFFWAKSIYFKIFFVLGIFVISVWASIEKSSNQKIDEDQSKRAVMVEQDRRDTINGKLIANLTSNSETRLVKSIDSVQSHIIGNVNKGLVMFHLHYDSVQNKVIGLVRDSAKKQMIIVKNNPPELTIDSISVKDLAKDTRRFYISIGNHGGIAKNISIKYFAIEIIAGESTAVNKTFDEITLNQIIQSSGRQFNFDFWRVSQRRTKKYEFYFKGRYYDADLKSSYIFEEIIEMSPPDFKVFYPSGNFYTFIKDDFRKIYPYTKSW